MKEGVWLGGRLLRPDESTRQALVCVGQCASRIEGERGLEDGGISSSRGTDWHRLQMSVGDWLLGAKHGR